MSFHVPESPQGKVWAGWRTQEKNTLQCLFVEIRVFIRQMEYTPTELNKLPIFLQESETTLTVPQVNQCLSFFPFLYSSRFFIIDSKYLNYITPKCKLWRGRTFLKLHWDQNFLQWLWRQQQRKSNNFVKLAICSCYCYFFPLIFRYSSFNYK